MQHCQYIRCRGCKKDAIGTGPALDMSNKASLDNIGNYCNNFNCSALVDDISQTWFLKEPLAIHCGFCSSQVYVEVVKKGIDTLGSFSPSIPYRKPYIMKLIPILIVLIFLYSIVLRPFTTITKAVCALIIFQL